MSEIARAIQEEACAIACDLDSKGAILGLTLSATRHDIAKAVMESLAFEMRLNLRHKSHVIIQLSAITSIEEGWYYA